MPSAQAYFESAEALRVGFRNGRSRLRSALTGTRDFWDEAILSPDVVDERDLAAVARWRADHSDEEWQAADWQLRMAVEGSGWSPRDAAVHVYIGEEHVVEYALDQIVRVATGQAGRSAVEYRADDDYEARRLHAIEQFSDADAAVIALDAQWQRHDGGLRGLTDADLSIEAEVDEGQGRYLARFEVASEQTVRGVFAIAVSHLNDHSEQLERAALKLRSSDPQ